MTAGGARPRRGGSSMKLRLALLGAAVASLACAQEYRALISGLVTDSSGAVIAGAKVVATNVATNIAVNTSTAADGRYVLAQVPTGSYVVTCEAAGFKKFTRSGVTLGVGDRVAVNIMLEVGAQSD